MEVFDKDGNPVTGVLSAEEAQAKIEAEVAAKLATEKAAWEAANAKAPDADKQNEPPEWFKPFAEQVQKLSGNQQATTIKDITSVLDAEKKVIFDKKFESLTGYDDTPEGLQKRAQDAYILTTGQPFEINAIDMRGVSAFGGSPTRPSAPTAEIDKAFDATFNITPEDRSKHASK